MSFKHKAGVFQCDHKGCDEEIVVPDPIIEVCAYMRRRGWSPGDDYDALDFCPAHANSGQKTHGRRSLSRRP